MDAAAILIPASPPETESRESYTSTPASNGVCQAPAAAAAAAAPGISPCENTAEYLIRVSCDFIHNINRRDFEGAEAMEYLIDHSQFTAKLTDYPVVSSYQEHVDTYKFIYSHAPDVVLQIGETNADVDDRKGFASVYINVNASGQPGGVATQGVSLFEWQRTSQGAKEMWLCVKHTALKGLEDVV